MSTVILIVVIVVCCALAMWLGTRKARARKALEEQMVREENARQSALWDREQAATRDRERPIRGTHPVRLDDDEDDVPTGRWRGSSYVEDDPADDLLNPANPLSPISPLNPITDPVGLYDNDMSTSGSDDRPDPADDSADAGTNDAPDTSSDSTDGTDTTPSYDPPAPDPTPSYDPGPSNDSSSYSGSDGGSFDSGGGGTD